MGKKLVVTRTLVTTYEVPYDNEHYPDKTLEEAVAEETGYNNSEAFECIESAVAQVCSGDKAEFAVQVQVVEE